MPQYILPGKKDPAFQALDDFTRGYIEALFFSETEPGTTRDTHSQADVEAGRCNEIPGDYGFHDLSLEALQNIVLDCVEFQRDNDAALRGVYGAAVYGWERFGRYSAEQAGHDLWFTRQGDGTGYWSREFSGIEKPHGEALNAAAEIFGYAHVSLDDNGKVYHQ